MLVAAIAVLAPPELLGPPGPGDAEADRRGRRPVKREDADTPAEQYSKLWDRTVMPHQKRYMALIDPARRIVAEGRLTITAEVKDSLRAAIELIPELPEAYWFLAVLQEREQDWQGCADSYGRLFAVAPALTPLDPPAGRDPRWALDSGLALCHAQAGQYEQALEHYKRISSRGFGQEPQVSRELGRTYMALGRLREAIEALSIAQRAQPDDTRLSYDLAVAYDRDEQEAKAQAMLEHALRRDRGITLLDAPGQFFAPEEDRLYYLGLAHAGLGDVVLATAWFRMYLHAAGAGPWAARARVHLDELGREPLLSARNIKLTGNEQSARDQIVAAVVALTDQLSECLSPVPGLVLDVRITATGRSSGRIVGSRAEDPRVPPAGVRSEIRYSQATDTDEATAAQQCVEDVASRIAMPRPKGDESRFVTAIFSLIAR